jgi:hypothetical protein
MISLLTTLPPESELQKLYALLGDASAVTRRMQELAKASADARALQAEAAKVTAEVAAVRAKIDADTKNAAELMDRAIKQMREAEQMERSLQQREEVHTRAVAAFTKRSEQMQEQLRRRVAEHAAREEALLERQQVVAEQEGKAARMRADLEAKLRRLRGLAVA